jgi:transporter family-2 protein
MILPILFALAGGTLVGVSRSINGRLSLATSPMTASFWNHIVGFAFLSAVALIWGGLLPNGWPDAPWTAWLGGTIGVLFVASGSWLVARIGATMTALLVIAGRLDQGRRRGADHRRNDPDPPQEVGRRKKTVR